MSCSYNQGKGKYLRKATVLLMALVMIAAAGFAPSGQSHAAGVNSAAIPSQYAGYATYKCIDISNWQGVLTVNQFKKLKSQKGITHVIVRVGYTSMTLFWRHADASYKQNISNAHAAGLKVGAYYYSQAKSVTEARKEADKTIELLRCVKKKITMPVAFDWEWGRRLNAKWARKNGKAANTKICEAYCQKIKAAGYTPMIYASSSVLANYLDRNTLHKKYKIWVAHYTGGKATNYAKPMYMWQFSSTARLGKSLTNTTNVDINYVFVKRNGKWVKSSNGKFRYKVGGTYLRSQWLNLAGKKYYLDAEGYRVTGYKKIGYYYYGFDSAGAMITGKTVKIGKKTYKFLSNGRSVLYTGKVSVSDYLSYKTGPGVNYSRAGKYPNGKVLDIVRVSGNWAMAGNGYWSCVKEGKKTYIKRIVSYPR